MKTTRPAYLFRRYFEQTATREEKAELIEWISREEHIAEAKELMDKIWESFHNEGIVFTEAQSEEMLQHILHNEYNDTSKKGTHKKPKVLYFFKVAAAVLLLIAVGSGYFFLSRNKKNNVQSKVVLQQKEEDVAPGGNHAVLTLSNGTTIHLDSAGNGVLSRQASTKIVKISSGLLAFNGREKNNEKPAIGNDRRTAVQYNTLTTPKGGQYQLILPDGSQVWLNAASSIRFPTTFEGEQREVRISGEAYFEIAQNVAKPFIVKANDLNIEVLGTSFNVNAYADEPAQKTVLIEGAIRVKKGLNSKILRPGQEATTVRNSAHIRLSGADIEEVIAWKNGLFHFEGEDMATIMHKIARWYDIDIVYEGDIPRGHYSGIISRNINLSQVLEILKLSGIKFKINNDRLTVINPNKRDMSP